MQTDTQTDGRGSADSRSTGSEAKKSGFTRLSVNLNPEAAEAIRAYTEKRHISYTEAVRRAIALLKFVDDEISAGHDIQVSDGRTVQKIVMVA